MRLHVYLIGLVGLIVSFSSLAATTGNSALPNMSGPEVNSPQPADPKSAQDDAAYKPLQAVQIYSQDELLDLIHKNQHLAKVKADRCQLNQDIELRAEKLELPAYQFLWGDMLAWGVCVPRNAKLGIHYMWQAAQQGLPAALEQLGRYYAHGTLVQANPERAVQLLRESASLGFLKAKLEYVNLLVQGYGSPYDYKQAYQWLYNSIIADKKQHKQATMLLLSLAQKMPPGVVAQVQDSRPEP